LIGTRPTSYDVGYINPVVSDDSAGRLKPGLRTSQLRNFATFQNFHFIHISHISRIAIHIAQKT
jgi:hypothetical protein